MSILSEWTVVGYFEFTLKQRQNLAMEMVILETLLTLACLLVGKTS